jgi:hypothetical protein
MWGEEREGGEGEGGWRWRDKVRVLADCKMKISCTQLSCLPWRWRAGRDRMRGGPSSSSSRSWVLIRASLHTSPPCPLVVSLSPPLPTSGRGARNSATFAAARARRTLGRPGPGPARSRRPSSPPLSGCLPGSGCRPARPRHPTESSPGPRCCCCCCCCGGGGADPKVRAGILAATPAPRHAAQPRRWLPAPVAIIVCNKTGTSPASTLSLTDSNLPVCHLLLNLYATRTNLLA